MGACDETIGSYTAGNVNTHLSFFNLFDGIEKDVLGGPFMT